MRDLAIEADPAPRPAIVRLRVALSSASAAARALDLPTAPCAAKFGDVDRLWLGPDQWLLMTTRRNAGQLIGFCDRELRDLRHVAVDASAALERVVLRGETVRALLGMGCGLDGRALRPGDCTRTRFARIAAMIVVRDTQAVELLVDRSHGRYLYQWLKRAVTDPLVTA